MWRAQVLASEIVKDGALRCFLWVYVKSQVYVAESLTLRDLKQRITDARASIPSQTIRRAVDSVEERVTMRVAAERKHSELSLQCHFLCCEQRSMAVLRCLYFSLRDE